MRKVNFYQYLQVAEDATDEQIKKAYRAMAAKYHPDKNGGKPEFVQIMQTLNHVYGVLTKHRAEYDARLADLRRQRQAAVSMQFDWASAVSGASGSSTVTGGGSFEFGGIRIVFY